MKLKNLAILSLILFMSFNISAQKKDKTTKVLIKTTMGNITIELYNETQVHKENFIKLVKEKYYDGVLFHRVINEFMVQTGDPESKNATAGGSYGSGGPGYTIPAEIIPKYFHKKGSLSAARTGDRANPMRRSSGSQFYLVTGKKYTNAELDSFEKRMNTVFTAKQREVYTTIGGTPHLDAQYTVFGQVIKGIEVIDKIQTVETASGDRPVVDVKIISMRIVK